MNRETPATTHAMTEFDATYYATSCGGEPYQKREFWLPVFDAIAARIIAEINPRSVLDAGCAMGYLVERLRARGVQAWGIDISPYAIDNVADDAKPYCAVGSVTEPFSQRYELIVSIEVLEHMQRAESERALANLCAHTDDILFSSSPDDTDTHTHYNVQPQSYWAALFADAGFARVGGYDAGYIADWAGRYRRTPVTIKTVTAEHEATARIMQHAQRELRHARHVQAQTAAERDGLRERVAAFERGRFMRFMRWLKGGR
jgi:SAM-dependent methyltransferase